MNDKIEEQIKHIKEEHSTMGIGYHLDLLSTLIQEERKEAVEGFVREFNNKCLHDSINESYNYSLEEIPNVVYSFVEEYLSSIGKDEE